jgi:hypothetical protein
LPPLASMAASNSAGRGMLPIGSVGMLIAAWVPLIVNYRAQLYFLHSAHLEAIDLRRLFSGKGE